MEARSSASSTWAAMATAASAPSARRTPSLAARGRLRTCAPRLRASASASAPGATGTSSPTRSSATSSPRSRRASG
eukprot:105508-Alexandrium_andersonii.AAC.1